jgi:hypothetical protein
MVLTTDSNGIQIKRYAGKVVVHKIPSTLTGDVILPPEITHIQKTSFVGCNNISFCIPASGREIKKYRRTYI